MFGLSAIKSINENAARIAREKRTAAAPTPKQVKAEKVAKSLAAARAS